jgi:hypothetical protein
VAVEPIGVHDQLYKRRAVERTAEIDVFQYLKNAQIHVKCAAEYSSMD